MDPIYTENQSCRSDPPRLTHRYKSSINFNNSSNKLEAVNIGDSVIENVSIVKTMQISPNMQIDISDFLLSFFHSLSTCNILLSIFVWPKILRHDTRLLPGGVDRSIDFPLPFPGLRKIGCLFVCMSRGFHLSYILIIEKSLSWILTSLV